MEEVEEREPGGWGLGREGIVFGEEGAVGGREVGKARGEGQGTGTAGARTLRFGTDGSGLTTSQLKHIRYNGEKVSLDNEGYLSGPKGLIISFF